jgi:hypothetical protein
VQTVAGVKFAPATSGRVGHCCGISVRGMQAISTETLHFGGCVGQSPHVCV